MTQGFAVMTRQRPLTSIQNLLISTRAKVKMKNLSIENNAVRENHVIDCLNRNNCLMVLVDKGNCC